MFVGFEMASGYLPPNPAVIEMVAALRAQALLCTLSHWSP
jgi:hypothetical protein